MLTALLTGFLFSIILVAVGRFFKGKAAVLTSLVPLGLFVYFASFIKNIAKGEIVREHYEWVPTYGVELSFTLDGISLLFALMITGIGFLVFVYTAAYLKNHNYLDRFYGYLSMFMAAMLGVVLSDNLISLFIFWELTSISSFFLIGFNNTEESSRKSAITALAITGLGGVLLMAGALLLGNVTGTYSITEMLSQKEVIANSPHYIWIVLLLFGAAFTKSAQFPFHFWLPGAMKAPTPVSTYLHSATMVKAGVYLLMRFTPVLGNQELWNTTLLIVGGITMVYAAFITLFKTDLKGILAYSTISALGILVFLIGLGTQEALLAAAIFIMVHALYKATLFLVTGIIDHETGTRNITQLGGLRKVMLPVAIAGILAAISNAGIPPSFGFLGKDLIYESTLNSGNIAILLTIAAVVTNILLLYAGFLAGVKPFTGKLPENHEKAHLPSILMWLPPVLLATLGIVFGLFPQLLQDTLANPTVAALTQAESGAHLKLWHGFNTVLYLSLTTIGTGLLLYFFIKPSEKRERFIDSLEKISPKGIVLSFGNIFNKLSVVWTNLFQNGFLRHYVFTIVLVLVMLTGYTLIEHTDYQIDYQSFSQLTTYEVVTLLIMVIGIFYTVFSKSRLGAVVAMGVVGYAICLVFVFYSAPDLAMTQFSIDTLTVILFVLVLYRLPKYLLLSDYKMRIRDGMLSIAFGIMIAVLALEVLSEPTNTQLSEYYAENSYVLAKGKNIVNVILVDFRGIDTFMEITVLSIAAIGVFALLKLRLKKKERKTMVIESKSKNK